jgi:glutamate synthase domain-containing protein 3
MSEPVTGVAARRRLATASQCEVDARGMYYRDLNARLHELAADGACKRITVRNVCGQRYIGTSLRRKVHLELLGTPGNDLGAFMDGPTIVVHGNAQDAPGNTLNSGEIVVHGRAGDIAGYSMRGGMILVRDDVGYRAGIHMKAYGDRQPMLVIGGTAQPFLGEYMAGGVVLVLGLTLAEGEAHRADHIGTGMHGGVIYLRGRVEPWQLGREVGVAELESADRRQVRALVRRYTAHFGGDPKSLLAGPFIKLYPLHLRPYGDLYAY